MNKAKISHHEESVLLKSSNGNNYLLSKSIPQVALIHPDLKYLIQLKREGCDLESWLEKTEHKDFIYYYRYLQFLEKNKYFDYSAGSEIRSYPKPDIIKYHLANTEQICFEATDTCNLKCTYCGYGELYCDYDKREGTNINLESAKALFDYIIKLKKSHLNTKTHRKLVISFYGGEPLLNFPFIEEIVKCTKKTRLPYNDFMFSITTNALLLDRYIDFFAENDFWLQISLDGNNHHNSYRVLPNGQPSYKIVYENILKLKQSYPEYFDKSVYFLSVLHDRNSYFEAKEFFKDNFNKEPLISELSQKGIDPIKKDKFNQIFRKKSNYNSMKELPEDIDSMSLKHFIRGYSGFFFNRYKTLLSENKNKNLVGTGTCSPFEKKVYMTVNGKILPCEKIGHRYYLGQVIGDRVKIDFKNVTNKYNLYFEKLRELCLQCYSKEICIQCIFFLNLDEEMIHCKNFMNEESFSNLCSERMSLVENNPHLYYDVMNLSPRIELNSNRKIKKANLRALLIQCIGYIFIPMYISR